MRKTLVFLRMKNGKRHLTRLTQEVRLHCEIVERLHMRALRWRVQDLDIDELFNQVVEKY